jgi:hypothetical protein
LGKSGKTDSTPASVFVISGDTKPLSELVTAGAATAADFPEVQPAPAATIELPEPVDFWELLAEMQPGWHEMRAGAANTRPKDN